MNPNAPAGHALTGADALQYLAVLAVVLSLLVACLTAVVHCRMRWLHTWLRVGWFSDLLLSKDSKQKMLCLRYLVGAINCIAGISALNFGAAQGVIDPADCRWLTLSSIAVLSAFYLTLRSGLNLRLPDPTMLSAHIYSTVLFLAWGYLIGGPAKAVALLLLFVILLFTMFTSTSHVLVRASWLATLAFGVSMWRAAVLEQGSPVAPQVQMVYFCVLVITLVSMCVMVGQLTRMRAKSTQRKRELTDALTRIQELAIRDELTGLFNRRHMLELLNTEKHRSNRSGRSFCVGLIDVDHFKSVNDVHGHGVGDQVLTAVATVITAGLRETDVVARWGGEEFLVMFTDTDCATADVVLSRIQKALAHTMVSAAVPDLRVAFSAGITHYQTEEMMTRTIDRADRALYTAKAAGRNRVARLEPDQHKLGLIA